MTTQIINPNAVKNKIQKITKKVKDESLEIASKGIVTYAEVASKNMPPPIKGAKSRAIKTSLYKRKIKEIHEAIKQDYKNRKQLIFQAKKGMKFVVYGYYKLHPKRWYATTLRNAKKYSRIEYRGLYKYLWGSQLSSIGEKTPTMFLRLLQKSPKLNNMRYLVKMKKEIINNESIVVLNYNADKIGFFSQKAKFEAKKSMQRKIKKLLQTQLNTN